VTFCCGWMGYDDGFQFIEFQEGLSSGPCLDFKWMRSPSTKRLVICVCIRVCPHRYIDICTYMHVQINKDINT